MPLQPKRVRAWTNDEAKRFYRRARSSALGRGAGQDAEDLAQAALLYWLEGRGEGQTVDQAVIDAWRALSGRGSSRVKYEELGRKLAVPFSGKDEDLERLLKCLESRARAVIKLRYQWGMECKEIGDIFGVTESRVSQMLRAAEGKIKEELEKETK